MQLAGSRLSREQRVKSKEQRTNIGPFEHQTAGREERERRRIEGGGGGGGYRSESREQRAESREQRAESREQRAESREQRA
jgi:hypothetical protein